MGCGIAEIAIMKIPAICLVLVKMQFAKSAARFMKQIGITPIQMKEAWRLGLLDCEKASPVSHFSQIQKGRMGDEH